MTSRCSKSPHAVWKMGGGDARAGQTEGEKNRIFCDHGLQGIATHLLGSVPMFPHKRIKKPLAREQKEHHSKINSERVLVEHP